MRYNLYCNTVNFLYGAVLVMITSLQLMAV